MKRFLFLVVSLFVCCTTLESRANELPKWSALAMKGVALDQFVGLDNLLEPECPAASVQGLGAEPVFHEGGGLQELLVIADGVDGEDGQGQGLGHDRIWIDHGPSPGIAVDQPAATGADDEGVRFQG